MSSTYHWIVSFVVLSNDQVNDKSRRLGASHRGFFCALYFDKKSKYINYIPSNEKTCIWWQMHKLFTKHYICKYILGEVIRTLYVYIFSSAMDFNFLKHMIRVQVLNTHTHTHTVQWYPLYNEKSHLNILLL